MTSFSSIATVRGQVSAFPSFLAERVYMRAFTQKDGLPDDLKDRWQGVVDTMLEGVDAPGPIYLMIDQKKLSAGEMHRRGGLHIDGYWQEAGGWGHTMSAHGGSSGHGGGGGGGGRHGGIGGHRSIPITPRHGNTPKRHSAAANTWQDATFDAPEGIILTSNVVGCDGFSGDYAGPIGDMGDCAHIDLSSLDRFTMEANKVYAGNVTFLHQTMPVSQDCFRTVVRLNTPGWSPMQ